MSDTIANEGSVEEPKPNIVQEKKEQTYTLSISQWIQKYKEAEQVARTLNIELYVAMKLVLSEKYRNWQVTQLKKLLHPSNRWAFKILKYILENEKIEWDNTKFPFKIEEDGHRPVDKLRALFSYESTKDGVTKRVKPNWGTYLVIAEAAQIIGWIE
jgi:hypothetical protein